MSSKICNGGIFTCKTCGYTHIIPWDFMPEDRRKCICIPCFYAIYISKKYRGYEIKEWEGDKEEYEDNLVKPHYSL